MLFRILEVNLIYETKFTHFTYFSCLPFFVLTRKRKGTLRVPLPLLLQVRKWNGTLLIFPNIFQAFFEWPANLFLRIIFWLAPTFGQFQRPNLSRFKIRLLCRLISCFTYSFVHSFIHSFVRSFIYSFIYLNICLFIFVYCVSILCSECCIARFQTRDKGHVFGQNNKKYSQNLYEKIV